MTEKRRPLEWIQVHFKHIESSRFLGCSQYETCLDEAALAKWEGWTCRGCPWWEEAEAEGREKEIISGEERDAKAWRQLDSKELFKIALSKEQGGGGDS